MDSIRLEDDYVVFGYTSRRRIQELAEHKGGVLRVVDAKTAYLPLGKAAGDAEETFERIKSLLWV